MQANRQPSSSVFICNIPYDVTEDALKDIFSQVGPVKFVRLVTDRDTGRPKGFGFVEYFDVTTAESAFRNLNGFEISGRNIRIDFADENQVRFGKRDRDHGFHTPHPPPAPPPPGSKPVGVVAAQSAAQIAATLLGALENTAPGSSQEKISSIIGSLSRNQLFEILATFKAMLQQNHVSLRGILIENPHLAKALFQVQVLLGLVKPLPPSSLNIQANGISRHPGGAPDSQLNGTSNQAFAGAPISIPGQTGASFASVPSNLPAQSFLTQSTVPNVQLQPQLLQSQPSNFMQAPQSGPSTSLFSPQNIDNFAASSSLMFHTGQTSQQNALQDSTIQYTGLQSFPQTQQMSQSTAQFQVPSVMQSNLAPAPLFTPPNMPLVTGPVQSQSTAGLQQMLGQNAQLAQQQTVAQFQLPQQSGQLQVPNALGNDQTSQGAGQGGLSIDQQRDMLLQVLHLTTEQIALLPVEARAQVIGIQQQFRSQQK